MSSQFNNATSSTSSTSSTPTCGSINKLIEKQALQFEEFGKRLQESHQEYEKELKNVDENLYESYRKKIETQAKLISSLRARIEELENDSVKKDQNIKNLRQEVDDFSLLYSEDMTESSNWNSFSLNSSTNNNSSQNNSSLNSKIQEISRLYGNSVKLKQFKFLKTHNINELIEYTKTDNFNFLNKKSKRYINFHIKNMLLEEFQGPNVTLSQDLDEYIKRDILPTLPNGQDNYIKCEDDNDWFDNLSDIQKLRVKKFNESGN
jgi:predicted RNase H-like nuclease (RuvC/YqgF family)